MLNRTHWTLGWRILVPVALVAIISAAAVVWLARTSEPATALEGKSSHQVLKELEHLIVADGVRACTEQEILTVDGYHSAHGLRPNAEIPRAVRALVEGHGVSFEDHEQRHIDKHRILLVSRDRITRHEFAGVEILAHIVELHWVEGGEMGTGRFEIVHAAAIIEC